MAKRKTKKHFKLFGKEFRLWQLGLIILALIFFGFSFYSAYLDMQDREKFDEIEYTIDTLTSRLEEEFEITGEYDNYCYESSEKFTTGPTVCVYQKRYATSYDHYRQIIQHVSSQADIVGWYDVFHDEYYDFESKSRDYSCSVRYSSGDARESVLIECSDTSRGDYY